jgi:hypothetical protein
MDINIISNDMFDINYINLSKSVFVGPNKKKISIGYQNQSNLHLISPAFLSNANYSLKSQDLKVTFDPLLGQILHFYNNLDLIFNFVKTKILKNNPDYLIIPFFKKTFPDGIDLFMEDDDNLSEDDIKNEISYIKTVYLKLTKNVKIYDCDSFETTIDLLKIGWLFKFIIKIDHIWIDTKTKKCGLNIELVQLKIFQPIYQIKCLIDSGNIKHNHNLSHNQQNKLFISKSSDIISDSLLNSSDSNTHSRSDSNTTFELKLNLSNDNPQSQPDKSTKIKPVIFRPPQPDQLLLLKNSLKKVI